MFFDAKKREKKPTVVVQAKYINSMYDTQEMDDKECQKSNCKAYKLPIFFIILARIFTYLHKRGQTFQHIIIVCEKNDM